MSKVKIFVIMVVLFFSSVMLIYLLYFSRIYDKFTSAGHYGRQIIVFSSGEGKKADGENLPDRFSEMSEVLKNSNSNIIFLRDSSKVHEYIDKINDKNKVILIDINASKLVVNKNTVLFRTPSDYADTFSFISEVRDNMKKESININTLNLRKDENIYGAALLKIDVSDRYKIKDTESTLIKTLECIIGRIQ